MKLLSFDQYKKCPWKNGLGFTDEIAIFPQDASQAFLWRISSAEVNSNSRFSLYPGYERILAPISGAGIQLIETESEAVIGDLHCYESVKFSGALSIMGRLKSGPIRDLNVFYKQEEIRCEFERIDFAMGAELKVSAQDQQFLFLAKGELSGENIVLKEWGCLSTKADDAELCMKASAASIIFRIQFLRIDNK